MKSSAKYKLEIPAVIPLIPIVGVNNRLPILHMSKRMVHIYTTEKTVHKLAIGYMVNPSLHVNKMFKTQVEKRLGCYFSIKKKKTIRDFLTKNINSVMEEIMIYETVGASIKKLYRVLRCIVYNIIDNYVCIDYLLCQSKTLRYI